MRYFKYCPYLFELNLSSKNFDKITLITGCAIEKCTIMRFIYASNNTTAAYELVPILTTFQHSEQVHEYTYVWI